MNTPKEKFIFNAANLRAVREIIAKYPKNRQKSAMLPLLDLAQRQNNGWLSIAAMECVANHITEPFMRVYEVATFYTMYNTKPVGKYHIQVCGTTPCWLNGSKDIMTSCEKHTQTQCGKTSKDGLFTISEVECLGACINAPIIQINNDYYENLNLTQVQKLIENLKK